MIVRSQTGTPCVWEQGGGLTNTGHAQIVAGPGGERLAPIYTRRRGSLACAQHALVPVTPGCWIVQARHHRGDFRATVWKVESVEDEGNFVQVATFDMGEWDTLPPARLGNALEAAWAKALCYHCREPHYTQEAAR